MNGNLTAHEILEFLSNSNVPTRWGNQLNGNHYDEQWINLSPGDVPTRWGNQLNGNVIREAGGNNIVFPVPTRWGNQLNGNQGGPPAPAHD